MTDENKEPQGGSEQTTPSQGNPEPTKPENPSPEVPDVKALQEKIETLSRQYKASTEEGLRLKEVTESLQAKLAEKESTSLDTDILENVDEDVVKVFESLLESKLKPLADTVNSITQKSAEQTIREFTQKHPGLQGEALETFNQELSALKGVYNDLNVAMEKAWLLSGGKELDTKAEIERNKQSQDSQLQNQAEQDKQNLINQASSGNEGNVDVARKSDLEAEVNNLFEKASIASQTGDPSESDLWIEYNLKVHELANLRKG